jgi:hypothetical protein
MSTRNGGERFRACDVGVGGLLSWSPLSDCSQFRYKSFDFIQYVYIIV